MRNMKWYPLRSHIAPFMGAGILLASLLLVGQGGFGWASTEASPLQISQDGVSGIVTQLPLQRLLDQFQTQLGIDYQAAQEELDKLVSVDLQQESVQGALEKILASWDYAFKMDSAGHIQHIFVLKKIPGGGAEEQAIKAEYDRGASSHKSRRAKQRRAFVEDEPQVALQDAMSLPTPLAFEPTSPGIRHMPPIIDTREPRVAIEEAGMEYIPPTSYPDMEVMPVSEADRQAMLQAVNPSNQSSFQGAGYPEMNIAPVSEAEAQAISQSLTPTLGSSMEKSLP